jgi:hypothetical protein
MAKGILFDHVGNMSAIAVTSSSVLSDLYEHIGSQVVIPLRVSSEIQLWVDAAGADQPNATPNADLTYVANRLGYDADVYGDEVFLGAPNDGTTTPTSLSNDNRLLIVLTHIRNATALLNR